MALFVVISIVAPVQDLEARAGSSTEEKTHASQNQNNSALAYFNKRVSKKPNNALAYGERSRVLCKAGKYQKALQDCNKAISIDPKSSNYYTYRAGVFRNLGKYQKAIQDCDKALNLNPKNQAAYTERASNYLRLSKLQKALKDYAFAIKISPKSSRSFVLRAAVYGEIGQYQKQIDDLTSATKISQKNAQLYEQRANAHLKLGQLEDTLEDCFKAITLNSDSFYAREYAAEAYEEMGLYDKAIKFRTNILMLKNPLSLSYRAKDYDLLGKFQMARVDRQDAIMLAGANEKATMQICSPLIDFDSSSVQQNVRGNAEQLKNNSIVLPFHYDQEGHICIKLKINDHPLQFMLDTGCAHSNLWRKALPGVAKVNRVPMLGITACGERYSFGWFKAKDVQLGNLSLSNVAMAVDEGLTGHKTLSGFLGGNILENFVVKIDYVKKQVIIADSCEMNEEKNSIVVPMRIRNHRPYCGVSLDEKLDLMALLDTGSLFNMSADSLLNPVLEKKLNFYEHTAGPWLGNLTVDSLKLKSAELGASTIKEPIFHVFPAAEAPAAADRIILGNSILSNFQALTFDYPSRRLILEPNTTGYESAPNLISKGQFYLHHNEMQRAVNAFSKAMILDSEFALPCYLARSNAFMNLKEYRKVLEDMSHAIKLDPQNASNYGMRAWAYEELGKYQLQIKDDTTAIRLDPHNQFAYSNRAWAYDKLGKNKLAQRDRRKAMEVSR